MLKWVTYARKEQANDTQILNQMEEKKVKYVDMVVRSITVVMETRQFNVERSPSVPSWGKWP